jgi:hypothetical protein
MAFVACPVCNVRALGEFAVAMHCARRHDDVMTVRAILSLAGLEALSDSQVSAVRSEVRASKKLRREAARR